MTASVLTRIAALKMLPIGQLKQQWRDLFELWKMACQGGSVEGESMSKWEVTRTILLALAISAAVTGTWISILSALR
jgi:hypothetical protein